VVAALQRTGAHVGEGEVEDGQVSGFEEEHDARAVGDGDAAKLDAHAARARFPAESLRQGRLGVRSHGDVFEVTSHCADLPFQT